MKAPRYVRLDGAAMGRLRTSEVRALRGSRDGENSVAVQVPDSTHGLVRRAEGGPVRRFVATHLGSRQVSRVIYGAIIGLALVVALEAHPPAAGVVIATLLGTALSRSPSCTASSSDSRRASAVGRACLSCGTWAQTSPPSPLESPFPPCSSF
jgi:hypothetical protein